MNNPSPLEAVFFAALEKGWPQERAAYLDEACAGDPDLRRRVEKMLAAQARAGSFLEQPAASPVATVDEPAVTEGPGTAVGPYKLLEPIGEGGFGVVFLAEQQQPVRRKVALKVLKPGMDTRQVVARFEAERQALAIMDHPNIAKVHDGGATASGRPYFVMELVKGVPITDFCDQNQVPVRERLELFLSVCQAVQHAHQKGVIHRDLKPSNVLVSRHDTTPVVKVIDFGVAKALGQALTDKTVFTGLAQMIGTPLYMSPEQAGMSDLDVDTRSDVYSLGVLLYELLTGTTPFDRERLRAAGYDELRRIIREEEPPRPSTRLSTLGQAATTLSAQRQSDPKRLSQLFRGELDWIVMKALEKDRNRRYESASAFAADVQRYLHDEPVLACPPSAPYRLKKLLRRNKRAILAVGLVSVALVLTVVVLALSNVRISRETNAKDEALKRARDAERQARLREADALVGHAHGIRLSRHPGQRFEALAALSKATAIGRELEQPPQWFAPLRNEAIAAVALPDIYLVQEWDDDSPDKTSIELSADFTLYVRATAKGVCTVHRLADGAEIARLADFGEPIEAAFGSDRVLGVRSASGRFQLWDLSEPEAIRRFEERGINDRMDWSFRSDGRLVALTHGDASISVRETATGKCVYQVAPGRISRGRPALHPTEPFVATFAYSRRTEVQVADLRTGAVVIAPPPPWPGGCGYGAWSPDGRTLTVPEGNHGKIQQYAFDPAVPALRPTRTLEGPDLGCPAIVYNPSGDRFASRGTWHHAIALFDAVSGRVIACSYELLPASCFPVRFDPTGKRLAGARSGDRNERVGFWSVADAREYRPLVDPESGEGQIAWLPAIHPGGRLAATGRKEGVALFDLETGRKLGQVPTPGDVACATFDGAGNLITNSHGGAFRWPVRPDAATPGKLIVGPPERLPLHPGNRWISTSLDGQVIAQCMWYGGFAGGWILHPNLRTAAWVDRGQKSYMSSVSSDGRWAAFVDGLGVKVYDTATGQCVRRFPQDKDPVCWGCCFTPDGRWLLTQGDDGRVYAAGTWEPGPQLGAGRPWAVTSAGLAVLGRENGIYRLVELATGRELARLQDPDQHFGAAAFTPDGTKLVVNAKDGLRVWDLRRLRERLAELRLDWDALPYRPAEEPGAPSPLSVAVELATKEN
jgi:serine/threonine protein kinase/WD40 repeat protein